MTRGNVDHACLHHLQVQLQPTSHGEQGEERSEAFKEAETIPGKETLLTFPAFDQLSSPCMRMQATVN
jgi:hypothetical protein